MWAVHGQRPRRLTVAGAAAAVVGLVLVLNLAGGAHLHPIGILWGMVAAVGLAAYIVLSARIDPELPATALAAGGMGFGTIVLVASGFVGVLPMHATFGDVSFAGYRTSWLVPVVGLSLVAAVFSYVAGIGAARRLGASLSSFVGLTEVLFAVLIAWVALGELPTVIQAVGGALIVAGIALVRLDSMRSPEPARAVEESSPEPAVSGARS
jgi:drug/metabolite transporter (DMT)-like permease